MVSALSISLAHRQDSTDRVSAKRGVPRLLLSAACPIHVLISGPAGRAPVTHLAAPCTAVWFTSRYAGAADATLEDSGCQIAELFFTASPMHTHDPSFILKLANRVFGDSAEAADWLDRPCVQLGGNTPRDLLGSDEGARRIEELLLQLDDDQRLGPA